MSVSLPQELNYAEIMPSLNANSSNSQQFLLPINGSRFSCLSSSNLISWDLPASGFLDPSSFYIKYKYKVTSSGETKIRGLPYTAAFQRLQITLGSSVVENINNYNVIEHMKSNIMLDVAQKQGNSISYGYRQDNNYAPTLLNINGRHCETNEDGFFSGQLPCLLSNAEKLVPLELMSNCRLSIFLDSISNIFAPPTAAVLEDRQYGITAQAAITTPSDFELYDVQLCYNAINFGSEVTDVVRNMGEKFYIKSSSWNASQSTLAAGVSSTVELIYNQRYASVKSLFFHCSSNSTNGIFDSFDVTSGGDHQFTINGKNIPQRAIQKNDIIPQLKKAVGTYTDRANSMSINNEFSYVLSQSTTVAIPSKIYVSVNTSVVPFSTTLLSGQSTQASPINVRLNIVTPTAKATAPMLITYFDCLLEIEPMTKNCSVKQ
jgi:hypothetical protein